MGTFMLRPLRLVVPALLVVAACATEPQPLDGVWQLASAAQPPVPLSMTLTEHDGAVTGSGSANGVDTPIHADVTGSASLQEVSLTFSYTYTPNRMNTIHYTAALQADGRLVGLAVYDSSFGGWTDSLTYKRP